MWFSFIILKNSEEGISMKKLGLAAVVALVLCAYVPQRY
jgi:hypothetical protein